MYVCTYVCVYVCTYVHIALVVALTVRGPDVEYIIIYSHVVCYVTLVLDRKYTQSYSE